MDHAEAVRLEAAEKYVLGELVADAREAYEEHYFECSECAAEVRAAAMFLEGARQLAVENRPVPAEKSYGKEASWLGRLFASWLRPAIAVPVFAAVLLTVIYQNAVTIPNLKSANEHSVSSEVYGQTFSLLAANVRGGSGAEITINPKQGFLLDFDFTPSASYSSYTAQLQNASGAVLLQTKIAGNEANQSLHFAVPAGTVTHAGQYALVFYSSDPNGSTENSPTEVQRLSFSVAFRR